MRNKEVCFGVGVMCVLWFGKGWSLLPLSLHHAGTSAGSALLSSLAQELQ